MRTNEKMFKKIITFIKQTLPFLSETKTTEHIFTEIYEKNVWHEDETPSGTGSALQQTRKIIKELPALLIDLNISTMLDIPCGDFHWMKTIDLNGIGYTGADIVKEIIEKNNKTHGGDKIHFQNLNLISDKLPEVDMVFCRDCLVHLSFADVTLALQNIIRSQSLYLLTTTFTQQTGNADIETGLWRPLNLELPPLSFPPPLKVINEDCTEGGGAYADKSLGLWRIADLRERLF